MSAIGEVVFTRRYWRCACGTDGSHAADELLGVAGQRYTKTVQKHCCRLAAETSFATTSKLMRELLGVALCPETVRTMVEGHGKGMARFQAEDTASEQAFQKAAGAVEFTADAGKVNTREEGWKDLKIAVISKREAGEPTTPDQWKPQRLPAATMVLAFALIATAKEFRSSWRPRPRRRERQVSGGRAGVGRRGQLDVEGGATLAERMCANARLLPRLSTHQPLCRRRLRRRDARSPRRLRTQPRPAGSPGVGRHLSMGG